MADGLDSIVQDFLVESYENLDQLDRDLVALEKVPDDCERLGRIFRTIHTIKGTCGFFGFAKLESVAHVGENLLSQLRDRVLRLDPDITTALLAMVDAIREILGGIEHTSQEPDRDYSRLLETLTRLDCSSVITTACEVPANVARQPDPILQPVSEELQQSAPVVERDRGPGKKLLGERLIENGLVSREDLERALQQKAAGDPRHVGEILVEQGVIQPSDLVRVLADQQEARTTAGLMEGNIRVDVGLLDKLMNLVGELVLARNQILQFTATQKDAAFLSTTQRLNLITTELQEGIMKTRMQPIGIIWSKFPRIIRDLAAACGKQVRIEMKGKETDLDKTIIEAIKDPLTHVLRNCVDHGIERPEVRTGQGKPAEGCVALRAFHEGGQVNIEISDDGAGINPEQVKHMAIERGLITREQAGLMSKRELVQLIFLPGFSTAENITHVSGRGVGLDVVKTNIEKIGGTVDIQSQQGKGTTLKIKIPLTLAIIPALVVTTGGDRYAIPQVSLLELLRLEGERARRGIERIHGALVHRLRGNLLPLVYLHRELQVEDATAGSAEGPVNIVVLQADDRPFGLVVQGINDTEEIVVKPLGKQLKGIPLFAGATIMGDGRVALILDVMGIAQRAGVISAIRDRTLTDTLTRGHDSGELRQTLLLFRMGENRRMAIPLPQVARLEEIPADSVEWADGREVVQYRDQIMPLLRLGQVFGGGTTEVAGRPMMHVVVHRDQGRSIGLVVDRILDIVETTLAGQPSGKRPGIFGAAVIQHQVTELIDIHEVIRAADPGFFESAAMAV